MDNRETIKSKTGVEMPEHLPASRPDGKYEKELTGYIHMTISIPCRFKVTAEQVEYVDENGKSYYEEEYEYYADEVVRQCDTAKRLQNEYSLIISEIEVEECKI